MKSNEDYNPQKIYYNYMVTNFLIKDPNELNNINQYSQINLCVYKINTNGKYPFIQYLLSNNGYDILSLPILTLYSGFNKDKLVSYSKVFLSGILQVDNFKKFDENIQFNGYYEFEKNIYLFFDTTNYEFNIYHTYSSTSIMFVISDEIINHRKMCNIPISKDTTNFFIVNNSINYLYNEKNEAYETPIVGFVGKSTPEKINFTYIFGESSKNKSEILGPYYYFTNFKYAIRQGGWSPNYNQEYIYNKLITDKENGIYLKGGIIRFALFTGITKYIENIPNYPIDESEIKKQRLNDSSLDRNYEIQTLRISDHDGIWAKTYDSAYLGNLELDDGSFIKESPLIVLKEYEQQIPLSYHFIDKNNFGVKYDSNNDSYRIV
jgi:hypothetical protein